MKSSRNNGYSCSIALNAQDMYLNNFSPRLITRAWPCLRVPVISSPPPPSRSNPHGLRVLPVLFSLLLLFLLTIIPFEDVQLLLRAQCRIRTLTHRTMPLLPSLPRLDGGGSCGMDGSPTTTTTTTTTRIKRGGREGEGGGGGSDVFREQGRSFAVVGLRRPPPCLPPFLPPIHSLFQAN